MARPERFELPTPWFVARYSIRLSYGRGDGRTVAESGACFNHRTMRPAARGSMKSRFGVDGFMGFMGLTTGGGERGIRTLDGATNPILP